MAKNKKKQNKQKAQKAKIQKAKQVLASETRRVVKTETKRRNESRRYYLLRKDTKGNIVRDERNIRKLLKEYKQTHPVQDFQDFKFALEEDIAASIMDKNVLFSTSVISSFERNGYTRMLINAGSSPEEAAAEIGVSVEDIINPENWNGHLFMGKWRFEFNYEGRLFTEVA